MNKLTFSKALELVQGYTERNAGTGFQCALMLTNTPSLVYHFMLYFFCEYIIQL